MSKKNNKDKSRKLKLASLRHLFIQLTIFAISVCSYIFSNKIKLDSTALKRRRAR